MPNAVFQSVGELINVPSCAVNAQVVVVVVVAAPQGIGESNRGDLTRRGRRMPRCLRVSAVRGV